MAGHTAGALPPRLATPAGNDGLSHSVTTSPAPCPPAHQTHHACRWLQPLCTVCQRPELASKALPPALPPRFPHRYASALDFHPKLSLLLCCGLTKPQNPPYFLAAYAASQPNGFAPKGFLARPEATGITCLRALSDTTGFLTGGLVWEDGLTGWVGGCAVPPAGQVSGRPWRWQVICHFPSFTSCSHLLPCLSGESIKLPGGQSYEILFYDLGSAASFQSLQPASSECRALPCVCLPLPLPLLLVVPTVEPSRTRMSASSRLNIGQRPQFVVACSPPSPARPPPLAYSASPAAQPPTAAFRGHNDIITSLARFPGEANLFVSGGKDSMVCLWDLRTPTAVAGFGEAQPGGRATAHGTSMVTSLDVSGHLLLSGGVDRTVKLWDLRYEGGPADDWEGWLVSEC